jgi:hypothetical protein
MPTIDIAKENANYRAILVYNNQKIHLDLQFVRISEETRNRNPFDAKFTIADRIAGFGDDIEIKGRIYDIEEAGEKKNMSFDVSSGIKFNHVIEKIMKKHVKQNKIDQSKPDEHFKTFGVDLIESLRNDNQKLLTKNKDLEKENNKLKKQLEELQADYDKNILKKVKIEPGRFKNLEMEG